MTPFTVKVDFQHGGICYEAGNTHKRHTIPDADVNEFERLGWVKGNSNSPGPADVFIQPDDVQIKLTGA